MAKSFTIELRGANELLRKLRRANNNSSKASQKAFSQAGLFLEGEVKSSISGQRAEPMSVDTGRFRSSVSSSSTKSQAVVSSNVKYGPILEFGSSNRSARHHFGNSFKRNRKKLENFFIDQLAKIFR
jgi:HK97 gp10 family phage protein